MPGKTCHQAVRNFVSPLNRALSCVTKAIVVGSGDNPATDRHALTLNNGNPVKLQAVQPIFLTVMMHYKVVKQTQPGEWKVSTLAYIYALQDQQQQDVLAYHWHPRSTPQHSEPHLHIYGDAGDSILNKVHLPTRRISIEELLRFLIVELKVKPLRRDWERVLRETQAAHEKFRTWD